jgi:N utilization substance protein B
MSAPAHPVSPRRSERVLVLNGLFMMDVGKATLKEALGNLRQSAAELHAWDYVERTLSGIARQQSDLDNAIRANLQHWKWERLARVDRNLMRLGCYEMLHTKDHPFQVYISEAVDLAKEYGDDNSGGFVNGVLDAIWRNRHAPLPIPQPEPQPIVEEIAPEVEVVPVVEEPFSPRIRIAIGDPLSSGVTFEGEPAQTHFPSIPVVVVEEDELFEEEELVDDEDLVHEEEEVPPEPIEHS